MSERVKRSTETMTGLKFRGRKNSKSKRGGNRTQGVILLDAGLLNHVVLNVRGCDVTLRDLFHFLFVVLVLYGSGQLDPESSVKFKIIWNIPSENCQDKHGISFQETLREAGISFNRNDRFYGEVSTILYPDKFGFWPRYVEGAPTPTPIDGGLPQEGDLAAHLRKVENSVTERIPKANMDGIAVINMEEWRPLWDRNWGFKTIYRKESRRLERERHPELSNQTSIESDARRHFQDAAREYMVESLRTSRRLRPNGQWGYYHFPYCYNGKPPQLHCRPLIREGNDIMRWLWEESSAIFPSIYLFGERWSDHHKATYMYGNIEEGVRVAKSVGGRPVYAYTKTKYDKSQPINFYNEIDMLMSLRLPADFGIDGVVIWGSIADSLKVPKCQSQLAYLKNTVAPYAAKLLKFTEDCSRIKCAGRGLCVHRGALDDTYAPEILRESLEQLNDFTIDDRYSCRCTDGTIGAECLTVGLDTDDDDNGATSLSVSAFLPVLVTSVLVLNLGSDWH